MGMTQGWTWGWQGQTWGFTGTTWGRRHYGDHSHGDHMKDLLGTIPRTMWGWQKMFTVGMTWGWHIGMTWGLTGMMWGLCGDSRGQQNLLKSAMYFCNESRLMQWTFSVLSSRFEDAWTIPHTCRLQLMYRWGVSYPKLSFLSKKCSGWQSKKKFSKVFALDSQVRLIFRLSPERIFDLLKVIYDPLKSFSEMNDKVQNVD